jgi:hypothetical protein
MTRWLNNGLDFHQDENGRVIFHAQKFKTLPCVFDDGGRANAGFSGNTGDCVTRAIAIAAELPYRDVYNSINHQASVERLSKRQRGASNARTGVYRKTYDSLLKRLGWTWTPTMKIGSGCQTHLREGELPMGRLIVKTSKHLVAVINGIIHDTADPSREGTRCVYGYWSKP